MQMPYPVVPYPAVPCHAVSRSSPSWVIAPITYLTQFAWRMTVERESWSSCALPSRWYWWAEQSRKATPGECLLLSYHDVTDIYGSAFYVMNVCSFKYVNCGSRCWELNSFVSHQYVRWNNMRLRIKTVTHYNIPKWLCEDSNVLSIMTGDEKFKGTFFFSIVT